LQRPDAARRNVADLDFHGGFACEVGRWAGRRHAMEGMLAPTVCT
jgi:hypothetical protein